MSTTDDTDTMTDDFEIQSVLSDMSESDKHSLNAMIAQMGPQELTCLEGEVKLIQNNVRCWLLRKNYINLREATKTLQIAWREKKKQTEKIPGLPTASVALSMDHDVLPHMYGGVLPRSYCKPATTTAITALQAATRGMLARKAFDQVRMQAMSSLVFQKSLFNRVSRVQIKFEHDYMHEDEHLAI